MIYFFLLNRVFWFVCRKLQATGVAFDEEDEEDEEDED